MFDVLLLSHGRDPRKQVSKNIPHAGTIAPHLVIHRSRQKVSFIFEAQRRRWQQGTKTPFRPEADALIGAPLFDEALSRQSQPRGLAEDSGEVADTRTDTKRVKKGIFGLCRFMLIHQ